MRKSNSASLPRRLRLLSRSGVILLERECAFGSLCAMTTRFLPLTIRLFVALSIAATALVAAAVPRVLPEGKLPNDSRLEPLKDLDGYFPFVPPASKAAWETRAERVRRQILVSQGLWPMPTKTPLKPVIHGRIDRGEYTVEKAYFESAAGFFDR